MKLYLTAGNKNLKNSNLKGFIAYWQHWNRQKKASVKSPVGQESPGFCGFLLGGLE